MKNQITEFFETQIESWPLAKKNVSALKGVRKKPFQIGDLTGYVQYNPERAVSTLAKVDSGSLEKRKCFLCGENRPPEQLKYELIPDWQLLINPYPILPYHFTIASSRHIPQKLMRRDGLEFAKRLPGMVVFFNDNGAGASAPDHLHFQAVPIEELPLIKLADQEWDKNLEGIKLPYKIFQSYEDAEKEFLNQPLKNSVGEGSAPVNAYFWQSENGEIRELYVARKSHRPDFYYKNPPERRAISPGAIDMAGILVTPFEQDFDLITENEIKEIYHQTGY